MPKMEIEVKSSLLKVWSFINRLEKVAGCFSFIQYGDRLQPGKVSKWYVYPEKRAEISSDYLEAAIENKEEYEKLSCIISGGNISLSLTFILIKSTSIRTKIILNLSLFKESPKNKLNLEEELEEFARKLRQEIETGEIGYWDFFN